MTDRESIFAYRMRQTEETLSEAVRNYLVAFTAGVYQNSRSICPHHHLMLPRLIRSQIVKGLERPA